MKVLLLSICALFFASLVKAQQYQISGTLLEAGSNEPISNSTIDINKKLYQCNNYGFLVLIAILI
jgi:hypothetical protein